ncbi:hypothetical protein POM88_046475 [Heracleum sosnowskyi]|uniref:Replication factor A C-terminal domain-containing protein n=1 Tax=Heracleum sosnowskyi TaxID=360622 RepID=A0AAD8H7X2_9APIA|nr:hypothetical protein POM88_046475 [Heracleum sosnowskyi]
MSSEDVHFPYLLQSEALCQLLLVWKMIPSFLTIVLFYIHLKVLLHQIQRNLAFYGQLEKRSNGGEKVDGVLNNVGASLSSTDATRSYFNIDYTPLNNLKHEISNSSGTPVDTLPPPTIKHFVTANENDIQEISIKSILAAEIPHGKDLLRFLCKAKIISILDGNGWYYICCSKCARAVKQLEGKYYCAHCVEESSSYTQRYRVVIHVEDASGSTSFTLFNKEAEQLIGIPLQKILTEIEENDNVAQIPAAIKNIVGKVCAFQIKVTKYNITHACEEYTVTRVLESSPLPNSDPHTDSVATLNKKHRTS